MGAKNLMVSRDQLTTVARSLRGMADQLQTELNRWHSRVAPASSPGAAGSWEAGTQLSTAIARTHAAVSRFASDLAETHNEVAAVLTRSADHYDEAERATAAAIMRSASGDSATLIQSGGVNQPLHERHHHAGADRWNGTLKITADAPFRPGSVAHHSWQQINKMILSTDPDAITNAGDAYQSLYEQLTAITGQLSTHGESLADSWAGQAAVSAVSQVQMMHQTAAGLQADVWRASQVLTWFGPVLKQFQANLPHPANVPPPRVAPDHPYEARAASQSYATLTAASGNATTKAAQQRLLQLNQHIETAYTAMPSEVKKNLPGIPQSPGASGRRGSGVQQPGGPATGTTLAGFNGPGLTQPGGPGAGAGGAGSADAASAGTAGGGSLGGAGQGGAASGGGGYGGFPMGGFGGAAGSQGGAGKARDSWDREDEETWSPSGEQAVIGEGSGIGADGMIGKEAVAGNTEPGEADEQGTGWDDDGQDIPPLFG